MTAASPFVTLSPLDEARFGVRSARASHVTPGNFDQLLAFCRDQQVSFLVARCQASDLAAAQMMERAGFLIMDTLVYFVRDLLKLPLPNHQPAVTLRAGRESDAPEVGTVATEAFRGYLGHYHADPRLARFQCDESYSSWAFRSCVTREAADRVIVAEQEGQIVGFLTLRLMREGEGEVLLNGVLPSWQRRGIYRSLLIEAMRWSTAHSCERLSISTQLPNIAPQKVWVRLGFEPSHAVYTFHKWF